MYANQSIYKFKKTYKLLKSIFKRDSKIKKCAILFYKILCDIRYHEKCVDKNNIKIFIFAIANATLRGRILNFSERFLF